MKIRAGVFNPEDARQIKSKVLGEDTVSSRISNEQIPAGKFYAILLEDMAAATNPTTGYVIVTAQPLKYTDITVDQDMEAADVDALTVVNRGQADALAGTLVLLEPIGAELAPVWVDCDPTATGTSIVATYNPATPP